MTYMCFIFVALIFPNIESSTKQALFFYFFYFITELVLSFIHSFILQGAIVGLCYLSHG